MRAARLFLFTASLLATREALAVLPVNPSHYHPTCQHVTGNTCIDSPGSFIPPVTGPATLSGSPPPAAHASAIAKPLAATAVTASSGGLVYYVDTGQTIHEMWFTGTQWADANLMASSLSGMHVALGTDVTVDSNGYVYYVDQGQTVHQMWWSSADNHWVDANLMASSQSGVTVQPGSDVTVDNSGSVYYVSSGQTVRKMWWGGSQWLDADLMASSGTSYRVESFTGITVDNSYNIYYVSTYLTVEKMWWGGSQFVDADLMASSQSGLTVQPGSQVAVDASDNVYYVSTAQAIHQMHQGTSQFLDVNINASQPVEQGTGVTVDAAGSVYYVDTGQTIHKMYISGGQWGDANIMASAQSSSVVVPGGGVAVDGNGYMYYVDPGQTIQEMYWANTQFADANLMASSGSGMHVSVAFMISGQVTNGGAGLNGVSVTLSGTIPSGASVSQTTTTATVNGNDGEYALLAADGGNYTVAPSLSGYVFGPAQQTFGDLTASQAIGFSVLAGTTTGTPPIVIAPTPPPDVTPPSVVTASASACNDVSGIWTDNTIYENTYSLAQVGSTVSGTVSTFEQGCGAFVSTLQGQATATPGNFTVTSTAPPYDACGYVISPRTATESVTIIGCSQAQVTVSGGAGASGFIGTGGSSSGAVSWIRTSLVPGISVSVDLNSGKVNTSLSGQNKAAALSVAISPSANGTGQSMTLGSHGNAQSGASFTDSLQRLNLAPGQYGSIVATWDDVAVTVPVAFDVLGGVRFSTYNTPAESQCSTGGPTTVFIFDAGACTYGTHTINSTFAYQTNLNGAGSSLNYGVIMPYSITWVGQTCELPVGGTSGLKDNSGNTFVKVPSATGSCNKTLASGSSVATSPNPIPANSTWTCSDKVLLVNSSDATDSIKAVQDYCPACSGDFRGQRGHIDTFISNQSCSAHDFNDYGNFTAIRLR